MRKVQKFFAAGAVMVLLAGGALAACQRTVDPAPAPVADRDKDVFPNKAQPLRICQVRFQGPSTAASDAVLIQNMADTAVDCSNWKIRVYSSQFTYSLASLPLTRFSNGATTKIINPKEIVFVSASSINRDPRKAAFGRTADTIDLFAPSGETAQQVMWQGRAAESNASLLPFWKSAAKLRIFSVMPNPQGEDTDREIVTLQATTNETVSTIGWRLLSVSGNQGKLLSENTPIVRPDPYTDFLFRSAPWLNNVGDSLILIDPSGTRLQAIGWKDAKEGEVIFALP
jgi:hypothetical protein